MRIAAARNLLAPRKLETRNVADMAKEAVAWSEGNDGSTLGATNKLVRPASYGIWAHPMNEQKDDLVESGAKQE
jgi:hypothetical protein